MKHFIPKKVITDQQYDNYWKLTVEYTDIFDLRFNNTLKMIVTFIDENDLHNKSLSSDELSNLYKKLQDIIYTVYPKSDKASTRKSINQFIKLGFVNPFFRGYHRLCKKFLNTVDQYEKQSIFATIFYEKASLNSSVTLDATDRKEINFLLKTLAYNPDKKLTKNDVIALMVTPNISSITKGYLTQDELDEQYQYSKTIRFEDKKYNQIAYLFNFLNYTPNIKANKDTGVSFIDPDEIVIDTKRDPIMYGLMRENLKQESTRLFGKEVCYLKKHWQKGLVCSHIKDLSVCLNEGKIDEAYDYNNSLLLSPDVDAYFDKYDISFDENGNILINDYELHDSDYMSYLSSFSLDKKVLNPIRLEYLKWHHSKFKEKAAKSKIDYEKYLREQDKKEEN